MSTFGSRADTKTTPNGENLWPTSSSNCGGKVGAPKDTTRGRDYAEVMGTPHYGPESVYAAFEEIAAKDWASKVDNVTSSVTKTRYTRSPTTPCERPVLCGKGRPSNHGKSTRLHMADPAAFANRVHLLWVGVGTNEPERMKTRLENLHASLDEGNSCLCWQGHSLRMVRRR